MNKLIVLITCFILVFHNSSQGQSKLYPNTFSLTDVKLLDGPFKHAQDLNVVTLLKYDLNRLLAPYLKEAGLTPKGESYPNWIGLDGHIGGHYLSALAIHYAATGNIHCKERMDSMVNELEVCMLANATDTNFIGYVGGVPNGKSIWRNIIAGYPTAVTAGWVPWYNLHKTYAGLRDAWLYGNNDTARIIFLKFCDWGIKTCSKLSDSQMETMLATEHGGMNEIYADAYQMTGDVKYLNMAKRFSHKVILNSMALKIDNLDNLHANTQVPKAVGFQRIAELSGENNYITASRFFWETVTKNRSIAIGGNSRKEFFPQASACSDYISVVEGPESCNTNNMLKLTEGLYRMKSEPYYVDFYERALFNHILSTQHPENGGYVYFTPARPSHYRVYSAPNMAMWCCVGTGMENHGKYGEFIYTHNSDTLYLNLYIASELNWVAKGITVTQETRFPEEERTKITIHTSGAVNFPFKLRQPKWADTSDFKIILNGDTIVKSGKPSSFTLINRTWNDGDSIVLLLPMRNSIEILPNVSQYMAFLHGPIVLGTKTGTQDLTGLIADDSRWGHIASGPLVPMDKSPIMLGDKSTFLNKITPIAGQPLHFKTNGLFAVAADSNLILEPFYKIHDSRYVMYFLSLTQAQYQKVVDSLALVEKTRIMLEKRTIDQVAPGEQQPEVSHSAIYTNSNTGNYQNEFWRDASSGGYISYTMATNRETKLTLFVRYWGNETGSRTFDIYIDGTKLVTENIVGKWNLNQFVNVEYTIPDTRVKGKDNVVVKFQCSGSNVVGGLFYVRILRDKPNSAGSITGPVSVCEGDKQITYSINNISGAQKYVWSIPQNATGFDTTNVIKLNFSYQPGTDTLSVFGRNSYADGYPSMKMITVKAKPDKPSVNYFNYTLVSSADSGNQWYLDDALITGATSKTYTPWLIGNYKVISTVNGCPSDTSDVFNVMVTTEKWVESSKEFSISPNPVQKDLIINTGNIKLKYITYKIQNSSGKTVMEGTAKFSDEFKIKIDQLVKGIYVIKADIGNFTYSFKFLKE